MICVSPSYISTWLAWYSKTSHVLSRVTPLSYIWAIPRAVLPKTLHSVGCTAEVCTFLCEFSFSTLLHYYTWVFHCRSVPYRVYNIWLTFILTFILSSRVTALAAQHKTESKICHDEKHTHTRICCTGTKLDTSDLNALKEMTGLLPFTQHRHTILCDNLWMTRTIPATLCICTLSQQSCTNDRGSDIAIQVSVECPEFLQHC